jgi:PAS domain S-box-containing protein
MHFVAMLAFSMPGMSTAYDPGLTLLSLALALGFTGAGFSLMNWRSDSLTRVLGAGLLMGFGVVAMHYVGMAAMRMDATLSYGQGWLSVSVLIAIGAATTAVWLASLDHRLSIRAAAAVVMGAAIAGMHYAGMKAAVFTMSPSVDMADGLARVPQTFLAGAISAITIAILLLALGAARLERSFEVAARREARIALRLRVADILREGDTDEALTEVASLIGSHFQAARVGYGQLDQAEDVFDYEVCWTDGSVPPLLGRLPAADFGVKIVEALSAGETVVIGDLQHADLSDEPRTRQTARDADTRAILVVPFIRQGRLRTIVYLNDRLPRQWAIDDVRFMEEIAERIRLVIERTTIEKQLRELNATLESRVEARTSELHRAEQARREADELYRAYFQNTPDPLFVIGVEESGSFIIEQINPAHEAGVGYKLEDVRGKPILDVLPPADAQRVADTYQHVVETGDIYHYRDVFNISGVPQYWDTTLVPLLGQQGRVIRIIGSSRNVTAQIVAEEGLRQAQKMEAVGQLTGGVAHDFNNLLTPIVGSLDRLQRKGLGDERDRRLIDGAAQAADRAKTLVHRLLSFARRQPLQPVPVDIGQLVADMAGLVSSTTGPQIDVIVEVPDSLPAAIADPNQVEMALLNLCVNARDAMPSGGTLRISVAQRWVQSHEAHELRPGSYLCLTVADTGTGMDKATLARAIEPFFSTKGVGQGTGLGLSMAHGLAAQLGGALRIDSELDAGTTVELWLPESTALADKVPSDESGGGIPKVRAAAMIVDDEDLARASTGAMLEELGYTVQEASSAEEALSLLENGVHVDVIVTDHLMPGMSGTELASKVLAAYPATQVLIISGYAEAAGIDPSLPRLTKPFRQNELLNKLRSGMEKAST